MFEFYIGMDDEKRLIIGEDQKSVHGYDKFWVIKSVADAIRFSFDAHVSGVLDGITKHFLDKMGVTLKDINEYAEYLEAIVNRRFDGSWVATKKKYGRRMEGIGNYHFVALANLKYIEVS